MTHPQPVIWLMVFTAVFGAVITGIALLAA